MYSCDINIPNDNSIHFQPELDYDFTDEEIRHIAKNLKKNKATGDDNILNKYIYITQLTYFYLFIKSYLTIYCTHGIYHKIGLLVTL